MYVFLAVLCTVVAFAGWSVFVVTYHLLTKGAWRKDEYGQMLMTLAVCLFVLFGLSLSNLAVQGVPERPEAWPGQRVVGMTFYVIFACIAWWPLRLLIKSQRQRKEAKKADG